MIFFSSISINLVNEVSTILDNIQSSLSHCVPLVQRLNNLLPEDKRLETFILNPEGVCVCVHVCVCDCVFILSSSSRRPIR